MIAYRIGERSVQFYRFRKAFPPYRVSKRILSGRSITTELFHPLFRRISDHIRLRVRSIGSVKNVSMVRISEISSYLADFGDPWCFHRVLFSVFPARLCPTDFCSKVDSNFHAYGDGDPFLEARKKRVYDVTRGERIFSLHDHSLLYFSPLFCFYAHVEHRVVATLNVLPGQI